jgi:hypothetical protein
VTTNEGMDKPTIAGAVRYTRTDIAHEADCSVATADRSVIPDAMRDRVLTRRGRYWYARPGALSSWLVGEWPKAESTGGNVPRTAPGRRSR